MVAWLPFALAVLVAFAPDLEKRVVASMIWRVAVILGGLCYSILLWHQQVQTGQAAKREREQLLGRAVAQSNTHSDEQIKGVRDDIKNVSDHSDKQIQDVRKDLRATTNTMVGVVARSSSDLSHKIDDSKPLPPELARLQFSFLVTNITNFPLLIKSMSPNSENVYTVDFTVRNISKVMAKNGDLWVQICDQCSFAKEPGGFVKRDGSDIHVRHKNFQNLNAGVLLEKMTVDVQIGPPYSSFDTALDYACENCISSPKQQSLKVIRTP
jgi:hypothetical protein